MSRGKQTCKILKKIRQQIADANCIEFVTSECRYKGDCLGTCPKCEAEVRYLEQQLRARSLAGRAIALAGISAGIILMSGCSGTSTSQSSETLQGEPIERADTMDFEGEIDEECLLSKTKDSIFNSETKVSSIKEGEISNVPNEVVTRGEMQDELPKNPDEKGVYNCVEQMPEYPGGQAAMLKFIADNLKYPNDMMGCFQGSVIVKFYVDTLGHVCDPKIVRELDSALEREVLRVVRLFPDFTPGQHEGKKVNVYMNLPISFDPNRY